MGYKIEDETEEGCAWLIGDYKEAKSGGGKIKKEDVLAFIKDEIKRLYNNPKNIIYEVCSSRETRLTLNKKQFIDVLNQFHKNNGDGFLHVGYDDNDDGVCIFVFRSPGKKTTIRIEI